MDRSPYQLGIDLGTTYTAAAVCRPGEARPETVALATAGAAVASVMFLAPDGTLLVGEPAQRRALSEPARVVREFKRRIGDDTPVVVGGVAVPADVLSARFVAWVVGEVARREGGPAAAVTVTHPVAWGEHKRRSFAAALAAEGLSDVAFLTEPQAAAIGYASAERIAPGRTVAVYDLGGGTFDAAVVRKAPDGSFAVHGRPTGIERLGGVDFDDAVFAHVRAALGDAWDRLDPDDPAVQTAVAGLRRECTAAKETLSADTEVMIPVLLPGLHTMVRLCRTEFEDMIRPAIAETVEALRRAVAHAQTPPGELAAVLLVGGSSRIPLVSQMVSAELGRPVAVDSDPKMVVAAGAAVAARGPLADPEPDTAEIPVVDGSWLDGAPASPPTVVAAPVAVPVAGTARRRRGALLASAVVGVGAVVALSATAAGLGPFASRSVAEQSAVAPAAPAAVDPWTGTSRSAENAADLGDTADQTTLAGPQRPDAVAAVVRPVARHVATGAGGARTVVARQQPPVVVGSETVRIPGSGVTATNGGTTTSNSGQNSGSTGTGSTGTGSTGTGSTGTGSTGTGSTGTGSTGTGSTGTGSTGTGSGSTGTGSSGGTGTGTGSTGGTEGNGGTGGTGTEGTGTGTGTGSSGGAEGTGGTGTGGSGGTTGGTGGTGGTGSTGPGSSGSTGEGGTSGGSAVSEPPVAP